MKTRSLTKLTVVRLERLRCCFILNHLICTRSYPFHIGHISKLNFALNIHVFHGFVHQVLLWSELIHVFIERPAERPACNF